MNSKFVTNVQFARHQLVERIICAAVLVLQRDLEEQCTAQLVERMQPFYPLTTNDLGRGEHNRRREMSWKRLNRQSDPQPRNQLGMMDTWMPPKGPRLLHNQGINVHRSYDGQGLDFNYEWYA